MAAAAILKIINTYQKQFEVYALNLAKIYKMLFKTKQEGKISYLKGKSNTAGIFNSMKPYISVTY